ncbi:MAG TPA: hypothetical protein P5050_08750 [Bacteroidia bacterium]|nr:hypothetical protein [Sphingobacteriales bacterium]HPD65521.1 hypothetical protein [Bacteroidia bacterium]HRS59294.1 hypothetical protein [Bacteroidia bacterium]HRU67116.1 hypothetical protein [Bacteroidia bacterium]
MAQFKGKHQVEEIEGVLCTLVEADISEDRFQFLKKLLEHNGYDTRYVRQEDGTYRLGVTDLLFNPTIDVYKRRLRSLTGHRVTPAYWFQLSNKETEEEVNYWKFTR